MNLRDKFAIVSEKMKLDFADARESLENKPGLKGTALENSFRSFLEQYLPKSLNISTGTIIDSTGKQAKQIDVIVSDARRTPVFYESDSIRVVPVECVYGVFEVKAFLDEKSIQQCFENMKSVRQLEKKAFKPLYANMRTTYTHYGRDDWPIIPTLYFVFALDSMPLDKLRDSIEAMHAAEKVPLWQRIDTVCVLNEGLVTNSKADGTGWATPIPDTKFVPVETQDALFFFYALTSLELGMVDMPYFSIYEYIKTMKF